MSLVSWGMRPQGTLISIRLHAYHLAFLGIAIAVQYRYHDPLHVHLTCGEFEITGNGPPTKRARSLRLPGVRGIARRSALQSY